MRIPPWSYSSLSTFENCPRQYFHKYVAKDVREPESPQMAYGTAVHKAFELRQAEDKPLPADLARHEPYMQELAAKDGMKFFEAKIGLSKQLRPTHFFANDVWYRGVVDFAAIGMNGAEIVDFKSGRKHQKFEQLKLFALHGFAMHTHVQEIKCSFYWTQDRTITSQTYKREQAGALWRDFLPSLRQMKTAFETDTWQPRQSGLCKAHCPCVSREFNGRSS